MSQSSELGGWIDLDADKDFRAHNPLSPTLVRSMVNNVNHAADEDAQVLVNQPAVGSAGGIGGTGIGPWNRTLNNDRYLLVAEFSTLLVRRRADGSLYPIRIRMTARSVTATVDWAIVLSSDGQSSRGFTDTTTPLSTYEGLATGSSTTNTYALVSFTYGAGGSLLELSQARYRFVGQPLTHGATALTVSRAHVAVISILGRKSTAGTSSAHIGSFYAAQYYDT